MGEGYGFSASVLIHSCSRSTSDKEAFLYIRLRMTPPIFNRQVTKEKGLHVLYTTVGSPCMLYM